MVHINNFVDKIFCINLKERSDRRKHILQQAKKWGLDITFFNAIKHNIGWKGCLKSHLEILKLAKKKKYKRILILEDDCKIIDNMIIDSTKIPKNWKQLYMGSNLTEIIEDNQFEAKNKKWVLGRSYTTHCVIFNNTSYDEIINMIEPCEKPIDVYFNDEYHLRKESYIHNPMIATQIEGYSDIEAKTIRYHMKSIEDIIEIPDTPFEYNEKTYDYKLKLKNFTDNELPYVSILTPTKNRAKLFPLAIHCFQNLDYPKEKIEWVIIDDSNNGTCVKDILPNDKRIKYIRLKTKKKLTISMKRNLCAKYAKHDILVNMDDDDYYLPCSLISRVKVLMTYPKINIVGCGYICCYDVHWERFYMAGHKYYMSEASMAFRKSFWKERNFKNKVVKGEGKLFLNNRKIQAYKIPYNFVFFAMNHKSNTTGTLRVAKDKSRDLKYQLPDDIMKILKKIHS